MTSSGHSRERSKNNDVSEKDRGGAPIYMRFQRNGEWIATSLQRVQTYDTFRRAALPCAVVLHRHSLKMADKVSFGKELMVRRVSNAACGCSTNRVGCSCVDKTAMASDRSGAFGPKRSLWHIVERSAVVSRETWIGLSAL